MDKQVIVAERLSKRYKIRERQRYLALRDILGAAIKYPINLFKRENKSGHIWALKDVSFEVNEGEVVGIIGRNGAGKTTLLKILSRITKPTAGCVEIAGRVGSLLEVGTGFHPELTGRENIYLNGAILGMRKAEIEKKFDEIMAFAEIERFLDTPIKRYSSGMVTRLAFAVAAHLEPDILFTDEVLAVGDLKFQQKCLNKMDEISRSGRTVLFVSHQMGQIRRLCRRVMWIEQGHLKQFGPTHEVVSAYELAMSSGQWLETAENGKKASFVKWEILSPRSDAPNVLTQFGPVTVSFTLRINQPIRSGHHGVALYNGENKLVWAWSVNDLNLEIGEYNFSYAFPMLPLKLGNYFWAVSLYEEGNLVDALNCVPEMVIATDNFQHSIDEWNGFLNIPSKFELKKDG